MFASEFDVVLHQECLLTAIAPMGYIRKASLFPEVALRQRRDGLPWANNNVCRVKRKLAQMAYLTVRLKWEAIAVHARAGIGYHRVASSIPSSDLPTLSLVGEGEVTISIKH